MSFVLIPPLGVLDEHLYSSSVAEDTNPAWNPYATYASGDFAHDPETHRVYISLQAGNTGHDPVTETAWWEDFGPTNRWAMFDGEISTATSTDDQELVVRIRPGQRISHLALFGLQATKVKLTYTKEPSGDVLFEEEQSLSAVPVIDWTSYYTAPFIYRKEALFSNIPGTTAGELVLTITGDGINPTKCGACLYGPAVTFGSASVGTKLGFIDYSRRDVDPDYGTVSFLKRDSAKTLDLPLEVPGGLLSQVTAMLDAVRGVPCVWVPLVDERYSALMVYGWMEDSSCTINEDSVHNYILNIKGLT